MTTMRADVSEIVRASASLPAYETLGATEARRESAARRARSEVVVPDIESVEDIDLDAGDHVVGARIYRPNPRDHAAPAALFIHGGGWVLCDLDSHDVLCRQMALASGCTLVSVDYRLAPEHPFPAALDDANLAAHWVWDHRDDLGATPHGIALIGDSAGANLAASLALQLRTGPGPDVAAQALLYPVTDCRFDTDSYQRFATGFPLTRTSMQWYWDQYAPDPADREDPRASPLRSPDMAGAAPALVITAGLDPLRDEGEEYARRLESSGVEVELHRFGDVFHGFASIPALPEANQAVELVARHLRRHLGLRTPAGARSAP